MEGKILLTKLTKKSTIPAGKNAGLKVGDVLKIKKISLIYAYFHYSNITFTDDVLDELNIKAEDRIPKPSKCPEKFDFYLNRNLYYATGKVAGNIENDENIDFSSPKAMAIKRNIIKSKKVAKYKGMIEREKRKYSKGSLQRKNQGH